MWLANFLHVEDYSYVEEMIQAGMLDQIKLGGNFPHVRAQAANYQVVHPNINSRFSNFRYR